MTTGFPHTSLSLPRTDPPSALGERRVAQQEETRLCLKVCRDPLDDGAFAPFNLRRRFMRNAENIYTS